MFGHWLLVIEPFSVFSVANPSGVVRILANPATSLRHPHPGPLPRLEDSPEGEGGMKAAKRNDARTELTTSRRRSVASSSRNDDAESMTHPTGGTCGIMHRGHDAAFAIP
jgi:hypothetical protein